MKFNRYWFGCGLLCGLAGLIVAGGCIVSDQLTTLTIHADESADLVLFRSNIRSTEAGEAGAKELAEYRRGFDERSDDDLKRLTAAGGEIVSATWVKSEVPLCNVVRVKFPSLAALEKLGTLKDEPSEISLQTKFSKSGTKRRISVRLQMNPERFAEAARGEAALKEFRQALANGISQVRIALSSGKFVEARGFTLAEDRQSALFDDDAVKDAILKGRGRTELFLEWEVAE